MKQKFSRIFTNVHEHSTLLLKSFRLIISYVAIILKNGRKRVFKNCKKIVRNSYVLKELIWHENEKISPIVLWRISWQLLIIFWHYYFAKSIQHPISLIFKCLSHCEAIKILRDLTIGRNFMWKTSLTA